MADELRTVAAPRAAAVTMMIAAKAMATEAPRRILPNTKSVTIDESTLANKRLFQMTLENLFIEIRSP